MPKFYMLIGVPASGKSTWRDANAGNAEIISTDDIIEHRAKTIGVTYNDVFKDSIKEATRLANDHAYNAFLMNKDVIWDQTNLTAKSRKLKLALVPKHWEKIAVVFLTPEDEEWQRRLASRPGKTLPQHILMGMRDSMVWPEPEEGFDRITVVGGEIEDQLTST
jgi:predicted kinase